MLFGAHISIAGGLPNAPLSAAEIGCEVFQMFSRSPQGGWVAPLDKKIAEEFKANCKKAKQKEWVIHAPYFINFASANPRIKHASITVIREELERSTILGAAYLMAHLGSYKDLGEEKGFIQLVDGLAEMLKGYKGATQFLIEISAGAGAIIGDTFEEIGAIIHHPKLKKYNIGVCYDTQHGFASGYDIRTPKAVADTLEKFDKEIGLENLKMFHCNDSKTEFNSHKDRHDHIGDGQIGLNGFKALLANKKLAKINFYLETEHDKVVKDLNILKKIRGKA
ncbi:MAG: putative endonuclease 4 [Candidatus Magasanikbacteria bacterium GW2011_GWA2_40_10]|uniref:Probable endonuclease 4 n=1 Tax=Candidatus Magasanikbacteria bacterium GW2011_GWA2_40_10 TaxID=1619037 RepID=A0A0G0QBW6_9BACT|nr:MAG: putative endonuclease 4 [Candidatus Magasanikbacteria bacterium GW2011_GWA2_40_10]